MFLELFPLGSDIKCIILLCAKDTGAVPDKQKVLVFSTNSSSSNINKISVFGKEKYCFHGPNSKIVKLILLPK